MMRQVGYQPELQEVRLRNKEQTTEPLNM